MSVSTETENQYFLQYFFIYLGKLKVHCVGFLYAYNDLMSTQEVGPPPQLYICPTFTSSFIFKHPLLLEHVYVTLLVTDQNSISVTSVLRLLPSRLVCLGVISSRWISTTFCCVMLFSPNSILIYMAGLYTRTKPRYTAADRSLNLIWMCFDSTNWLRTLRGKS